MKILLDKNKERENGKSEEREREKKASKSFYVDFFGVFERKKTV